MRKILDEKTKNKLINYLESRFGIKKSFFENYLFVVNGVSVSIISNDKKQEILKILNTNFIKNIGIEIFSNYKNYTLSSLGIGVFNSKEILQNYIVLDRQQTEKYLKGIEILEKEITFKKILSNGNVICVYNNNVIGNATYETGKIVPNLVYVHQNIK